MNSALKNQVGGKHYKLFKIQPIELITRTGLSFIQGNIVKYVSRYKAKNGKQDIEKCIHYAELAIELDENSQSPITFGYTYCRANSLSQGQTNVVIAAMLGDYHNVIRHCNQIIKQEYS